MKYFCPICTNRIFSKMDMKNHVLMEHSIHIPSWWNKTMKEMVDEIKSKDQVSVMQTIEEARDEGKGNL